MGKLFVIGAGFKYEDLTIRSDNILSNCDFIYCDEKMYHLLASHYDPSKIISNDYNKTRERCVSAITAANNSIVSLVGSGDTGVYGISSIVFALVENMSSKIDVEIIPGLTSAITGAALLGSPLTKDFAVISLSNNLRDEETFERIESAAKTNFNIVFYSPCNSTKDNLLLAKDILLKYRDENTIIGLTNSIGMPDENIVITNLKDLDINDIHSFTTIFVGRNDTYTIQKKKIITPLY